MNKQAAEILITARKNKGYTQAQMAEMLAKELDQGYSQRQYQKLEEGIFPKYKKEVAEAIDKLLGTDLRTIIYEQIVPHGTDDNDSNFKNVSESALAGLIESNKILAQAHDKQAEANRQQAEANRLLAESNALLIGKITGGGFEGTHSNLDYKVGEILLILADLSTGKKYKSKGEAVAAFHRRIYGIQEKNSEVGTYEEGGK